MTAFMTTPRAAVRVAAAAGLPVATAAALVPLRSELDNATALLVLAAIVPGIALLGSRWATAIAAVSAALSFDVMHTEPYGSFVIHGADDVVKTLLLLLPGLLAATLVARRAEAEAGLEERRLDLRRVREVTRAAERSPEALVERLELDLTQLLGLRSATYRPGESDEPMPRITGQGVVIPPGTPQLDPDRPGTWAVELPVCVVDRQVGRFVLLPDHPSSGVDLPPGRRDLALTWADQLAFALDRPARNGGIRG
jgi:hypothetical protein